MGNLWTCQEVVGALKEVLINNESVPEVAEGFSGVSIDSRTVKPGDLFVALQGDTGNGHQYVQDALRKGARAAIVAELGVLYSEAREKLPLFVVRDTLDALECLGRAARERSKAKIIGITGSVGKTSVRSTLSTILGAQALTSSSQKSYNNHWGVPLSLAHLDSEAFYGVFEMGMNAPGEIRALSQMVRPHVALITRIGDAHVGRLGSRQAVAEAKAEIFTGLESGKGIAVLNTETPFAELLAKKAREAGVSRILWFGKETTADVTARRVRETAEGFAFVLEVEGRPLELTLPFLGYHWIENILGVFGVLAAVGADLEKAAHDLKLLKPVEGRGVIHHLAGSQGPFTVIDDGYNANPTSMAAGISMLSRFPGRRMVILGDMLELGEESALLHENLKHILADTNVEKVFACGENMKVLFDALPSLIQGKWCSTSLELVPYVKEAIGAGDVVLIKGSNSMRMSRILEALQEISTWADQAPKRNHA